MSAKTLKQLERFVEGGTVIYHGLDGYGIKWGRMRVDADAILRTLVLERNTSAMIMICHGVKN